MPLFRAKLYSFELDTKSFTQNLGKDIEKQMLNAGKAFLRIAKISTPVRTGFASGGFANLEEAVGIKTAAQQPRSILSNVFRTVKAFVSPKSGRNLTAFEKPLNNRVEYYTGAGGKILKTPAAGRQFATPAKAIFVRNGFIFTFNFDIDITYFNINDVNSNPRTPSAPWRAFERGRQFFNTYLQRHAFDGLKVINNFMSDVEYSVSGGQVSVTLRTSKSEIIKVKNDQI